MHHRPTAAFILSLIGGIFVLLIGAWLLYVASVLSALGLGGFGFFFLFGLTLGAYGAITTIVGLLIVVFAVLLFMRPKMHLAFGALIVVLAVVSLPFGFGGFVIGFILALIGGILGIVFKPMEGMMAAPMPPGTMPAATTGGAAPMTCPACGGAVNMQTRTCTMCGRAV